MKVFTKTAALRAWLAGRRRRGGRVGLVPTMGALHAGHLSLLRRARRRADVTVLSIFVNPTQFGPQEDYAQYPRTWEEDRARAAREGADAVFRPAAGEMYGEGVLTSVRAGEAAGGFCGASRPGHFDGVATVVLKLFNIVQPDWAVFGQKDAQQCAVIRQMVRDLDLPVRLVFAPTVREPDGLAMSSRNRYLSPAAREKALVLYRSLRLAKEMAGGGGVSPAAIQEAVQALWAITPEFSPEYFGLVDPATFRPLTELRGNVLALTAGRIEGTRLIDNIMIMGKFPA